VTEGEFLLLAGWKADMQDLRDLLFRVYKVPDVISSDQGCAVVEGGESCMCAEQPHTVLPPTPSPFNTQGIAMLYLRRCYATAMTKPSSSWMTGPCQKQGWTCCITRYASLSWELPPLGTLLPVMPNSNHAWCDVNGPRNLQGFWTSKDRLRTKSEGIRFMQYADALCFKLLESTVSTQSYTWHAMARQAESSACEYRSFMRLLPLPSTHVSQAALLCNVHAPSGFKPRRVSCTWLCPAG
jgi:hypothetical protein